MSQPYLILIWIKFSSIWESSKGWISTKRSRTRMIEINSTLFALNFNLVMFEPRKKIHPDHNFTSATPHFTPGRFRSEHKPPHPLISISKGLQIIYSTYDIWNSTNRRLKPTHFITFLNVCRRFKFDILTIELTPWKFGNDVFDKYRPG